MAQIFLFTENFLRKRPSLIGEVLADVPEGGFLLVVPTLRVHEGDLPPVSEGYVPDPRAEAPKFAEHGTELPQGLDIDLTVQLLGPGGVKEGQPLYDEHVAGFLVVTELRRQRVKVFPWHNNARRRWIVMSFCNFWAPSMRQR